MSVVLFVLSGCYVVMLCVKRNKKMLITKKKKIVDNLLLSTLSIMSTNCCSPTNHRQFVDITQMKMIPKIINKHYSHNFIFL